VGQIYLAGRPIYRGREIRFSPKFRKFRPRKKPYSAPPSQRASATTNEVFNGARTFFLPDGVSCLSLKLQRPASSMAYEGYDAAHYRKAARCHAGMLHTGPTGTAKPLSCVTAWKARTTMTAPATPSLPCVREKPHVNDFAVQAKLCHT
jgi:hypothetical protein